MDVANVFFLIGSLLSILAVIRDRKILRGYSLIGSLVTFLGMFLCLIYFIQIALPFSIASSFITSLYWLIVTVYVTYNKIRRG